MADEIAVLTAERDAALLDNDRLRELLAEKIVLAREYDTAATARAVLDALATKYARAVLDALAIEYARCFAEVVDWLRGDAALAVVEKVLTS